jgi:hypothetical protein
MPVAKAAVRLFRTPVAKAMELFPV